MRGVLAIQHVHLHWDKSGRGADAGTLRNALPRALPFQAPGASEAGWLHRISFDARTRYQQDEAWHDLVRMEGSSLPVATRIDGDHLRIKPLVWVGTPRRPHLNGWIARLPFGQRLSFRINSKADGDHDRWYVEDHLHIGWADRCTLDLPLFRDIDERVLLY